MKSEAAYKVERIDRGLLVDGPGLEKSDGSGGSDWDVMPIDQSRLLMFSKSAQQGMASSDEGFIKCNSSTLTSLLCGLQGPKRHWMQSIM